MTKILVVFYSTYGHNWTMAKKILEGANAVPGVEATLCKIRETLSDEILTKMHALEAAKQWADVTVITPDIIKEADGVIFCFPTRYGNMPAQVKTFFDSCGQIWMQDALVGKVAGISTSSGSQHGGQESTILSSLPVLFHLGFIYVGMPYSQKLQQKQNVIVGGSPYGPSTIAGDGSRQPSTEELEMARWYGDYVSKTTHALHTGRALTATEQV